MLRLIQQCTASVLCCLMLVSGVVNASEVKEVYWEDLVPPDFNIPYELKRRTSRQETA